MISFSFVYAHKDGLYAMKEVIARGVGVEIGNVSTTEPSSFNLHSITCLQAGMVHSVPKKEDDDRRTLHELQFEVDRERKSVCVYVSVAMYVKERERELKKLLL